MRFYTLGTSLIAAVLALSPPASAAKQDSCARKNILIEVFTADGSTSGDDALAPLREDARAVVVTRATPQKGGDDRLAEYVGKKVQWVTHKRPQVVLNGAIGFDPADAQLVDTFSDLHSELGVPMDIDGATVKVGVPGAKAELRFLALTSKKQNRVIGEQVVACSESGCSGALPDKLLKAKGADRWAVVLQSPTTGRVMATQWIVPEM